MSETKYFLDITPDVCPMTFVKTKLLLERIPVENVPRSVAAHGHEVVSLVPETAAHAPRDPHILTIRRK